MHCWSEHLEHRNTKNSMQQENSLLVWQRPPEKPCNSWDVANFLNTGKSTSKAKICLSGYINAVKLPFSVKGWQAQNPWREYFSVRRQLCSGSDWFWAAVGTEPLGTVLCLPISCICWCQAQALLSQAFPYKCSQTSCRSLQRSWYCSNELHFCLMKSAQLRQYLRGWPWSQALPMLQTTELSTQRRNSPTRGKVTEKCWKASQ